MRALIWQELAIISRTSAFWWAAAAHVSLLTAFVAIWGHGLPIANARTNWEQFISLERLLLVVILPWAAARCGRMPAAAMTLRAVAAGRPVSHLMWARCIGFLAALLVLLLSATPVVLVMADIAAVTTLTVILTTLAHASLVAVISAIAGAAALVCATPFVTWAVSAAFATAIAAVAPLSPVSAPIWALAALAVAAATMPLADRLATYLPEEAA